MDFSPLVGMAAQGVSEGINSLIGEHNLSVKTKYQKHLMDYQMQQQRQMMLDEMSLRKQSYRNAGLSTAALSGSFGGNVAMPNAGAGDLSTVGKGVDAMEAFSVMANLKNINAEARLKEAEAENQEIKNQFERDRQQTEVDQMKVNLKLAQDTFDDNVKLVKENVRATAAKAGLDEQQTKVAEKTVEQLTLVCSGLSIDNESKGLKLLIDKITSGDCINRIKAEAEIAMYTRDVKRLDSVLASYGISVNASDLTNFMGIVLQGKADKVIEAIGETIGKVVGALPAAIGAAIGAMIDGLTGDNWFGNSARATGKALNKLGNHINRTEGGKVMKLKFENPMAMPSLR